MVRGSSTNSEEAIKEETLEHKKEKCHVKQKCEKQQMNLFILSVLNNVYSWKQIL